MITPFLVLVILAILLAVAALVFPNAYLCPASVILLAAALLIK